VIDITPADFVKLYGGLVKVLQVLEKAGPQGLPTNAVGKEVFNSRTYGWHVLVKAEKLGYIERRPVRIVRARGRRGHPYYKMNYLLPKGRKLLRELGGV
jgi:hypothetical protein